MSENEKPRDSGAKRASERTCVGCGKHAAPEDLVRVVLGPHEPGQPSEVAVDLAGGSHGRGAHVHPARACLAKAAKSGLARSFKTSVATSEDALASMIVEACDRRILGLLAGAMRGRMLAIGADATIEALAKDAGAWVVVASDAASVVDKRPIAEAIAQGRAVSWKDKATLGAIVGRDEVAVTAVTNESVATQIARARRMADAVGTQRSESRGEACRSREVR